MASKPVDTLSLFTTGLNDTQFLADTRQEVVNFIAGSAITAGQWVAFDTSKTTTNIVNYVIPCGQVTTGNPRTIGVALTAQATAGGIVAVVVAGYFPTASVLNGTTAGKALIGGKSAVGKADDIGIASTSQPCGVALGTSSGSVGPVWVIKQF